MRGERRPGREGGLLGGLPGVRVLDGAMGTALIAGGADAMRLEALLLEEPARVRAIHAAHARAGAEAITTHSFGLARRAAGGEDVRELGRRAVALAREVERPVLGSIGAPAAEPAPRAVEAAARALAGADALLLETFTSGEALLAALRAAGEVGLPVWACASFADGRTREGWTPAELAERLGEAGAAAIGAGCGDGPEATAEAARGMLGAGAPVLAIPTAGVGRAMAAGDFGALAGALYEAGVAAVGGCCGTDAAHVAAVAAATRGPSA